MQKRSALFRMIAAMAIFGTIGLFRRLIPLPSSLLALLRGGIGALFLLLLMAFRRRKFSAAVRENGLLLLLSGAAIGFNWILLFEAYNYTTVATATLCYYMAPIFVLLASPAVLGEKLTARRLFCILTALFGMILVSGVLEAGFSGLSELTGALCGLGAAVLYAFVILMNKEMKPMPSLERTVFQLAAAAAALGVYVPLKGEFSGFVWKPLPVFMTLTVCVLHTGVAYALYFRSVESLPAPILALFSYIDPVVAVLLSALFLKEPLTISTAVGAVLVLGSAVASDLPEKEKPKPPKLP